MATYKLFNVVEKDFRRYADGTCQTFPSLETAIVAAELLNGGGSKLFIVRPGTPATDCIPFFGAHVTAEAMRAANRRWARGQAPLRINA